MKVLPKVIRILELFAHGDVLPFSQIVERSQLTRSNTAHIVGALCQNGLLTKTSFGYYTMGRKIFELAGFNCQQNQLNILAQRTADRIASELGELGVVVAFWRNERITLAKVQPESMVQLSIADRWFERSGWYRLSSGRLLLALQSDPVIADIIQQVGLPTAADWPEAISEAKLYDEIRQIRTTRQAMAIRANGKLTSLAVPVKDADGCDSLAISTVYITGSKAGGEAEVFAHLRQIADELTEQIKFHHIVVNNINTISSAKEK